MFSLVPYGKKQNSIGSVFDELMNDSFFSMPFPTSFTSGMYPTALNMKTDIKETETEYTFETELPGVKKEEINVKLENKVLTISVNRNEEVNEDKDGYIRRERKTGSYARSFRVSGVQEDSAKAKYEEGILKITLQKVNEQERQLENKITIE